MTNKMWIQLVGVFVIAAKVIIVATISFLATDNLLYKFLGLESINNFIYWIIYCWFVICTWTFVDNS